MSASKATVLDNLPARFIKDSSLVIASPLAHVVNLLISIDTVLVGQVYGHHT